MKTSFPTSNFLIIFFSLIISMTGCNSDMTPVTSEDLERFVWQLDSLNGDSLIAGTQITLSIRGQKISGSGGANQYNASWIMEANSLSISAIAATKRMRMEPKGSMPQEQRYFNLLQEMKTIELLSNKELLLTDGAGQSLTFIPQPEL